MYQSMAYAQKLDSLDPFIQYFVLFELSTVMYINSLVLC